MIFFHLTGEMDLGEDLVPEVMLNDTDARALRELLNLPDTQRTVNGLDLLKVLERCEFLVENPFYVESQTGGWDSVALGALNATLKEMHELLYFAKVAGCGIAWS